MLRPSFFPFLKTAPQKKSLFKKYKQKRGEVTKYLPPSGKISAAPCPLYGTAYRRRATPSAPSLYHKHIVNVKQNRHFLTFLGHKKPPLLLGAGGFLFVWAKRRLGRAALRNLRNRRVHMFCDGLGSLLRDPARHL